MLFFASRKMVSAARLNRVVNSVALVGERSVNDGVEMLRWGCVPSLSLISEKMGISFSV